QVVANLHAVARRDCHRHDPARDDGTKLGRSTMPSPAPLATGPLAEPGPTGVLDLQLEAPAADHDLDPMVTARASRPRGPPARPILQRGPAMVEREPGSELRQLEPRSAIRRPIPPFAHPLGREAARRELGIGDYRAVEWERRLDAGHLHLAERPPKPGDRLGAIPSMGHDLGDQRVVV